MSSFVILFAQNNSHFLKERSAPMCSALFVVCFLFVNIQSVTTLEQISKLLKSYQWKQYKKSFSQDLYVLSQELFGNIIFGSKVQCSVTQTIKHLHKVIDEEIIPRLHFCERRKHNKTHSLAGVFCYPFDLVSTGSIPFKFMIAQRKQYFLNLTFSHYQTNLFGEYVFLLPAEESLQQKFAKYRFCGQRHPWSVMYTDNKVILEINVTHPSSFKMFFQIFSSTLMLSQLNFCQLNDPCQQEFCSSQKSREESFLPKDKIRQTKVLLSSISKISNFYIYVLNIHVNQYNYLKIYSTNRNEIFAVHDGPTAQCKSVEWSNFFYTLATFVATVIVHWNNTKTLLSASFVSVPHNRTNRTLSCEKQFVFDRLPTKNSEIVSDVIWLAQSQSFSYNVTLDFVSYTGPDKAAGQENFFGQISVYFLDKSGKDELVLGVSRNMSRHQQPYTQSRSAYGIVSRLTTEFVIIVYYYHSLFSFIRGSMAVSPTPCVGHFSSTRSCLMLYLDETHSAPGMTLGIPLREHKKCLVMTILPTASYFLHGVKCRWRSYSWTRHVIMFQDLPAKAFQIEAHILGYRIQVASKILMMERHFLKNLFSTSPKMNNSHMSESIKILNYSAIANTEFLITAIRNLDFLFDKLSFISNHYGFKFDVLRLEYHDSYKYFDLCNFQKRPIGHEDTNFFKTRRSFEENVCVHRVSDGWITLSIQYLASHGEFGNISLFLPQPVVFAYIFDHCAAEYNITDESNLLTFFHKEGFRYVDSMKEPIPTNATKVAFYTQRTCEIKFKDIKPSIETLYIKYKKHFARYVPVTIEFRTNLVTGLPINRIVERIVSHSETNLIIPSLTRCRYCSGLNECGHIEVMLKVPPGYRIKDVIEIENHTYSRIPNISLSSHNTLLPQWESPSIGISNLLSWFEANTLCKSNGTDLPSVHSTLDMELIATQVKIFEYDIVTKERKRSKVERSDCPVVPSHRRGKLKGEEYDFFYPPSFHFYQTIAIFIGLNSKVSTVVYLFDDHGSLESLHLKTEDFNLSN